MRIKICYLLIFILVISIPINVLTAEIEIHSEIENMEGDRQTDSLRHVIKVQDRTSYEHIITILFDEKRGEFEKGIEFALEKVPDTYNWIDYKADIPFYREPQKMEFLLYAHNLKPDSQNLVRELHQVNPNDLDKNDLFRYFAKGRIVAEFTIDRVDPSGVISRKDVRAVYHYLQSVRELSYKYHVEADELSEKAANWLNTAYQKKKNTCDNAVGKGQTPFLLDQIDHLSTEKYARLYRNILKMRTVDYDAYCSLQCAIQDSIFELSNDELEKINSKKKLTPLIANLVAECLWRSAMGYGYRDAFKENDKDEKIRKQILILEQQIDVAKPWDGLVTQLKGNKQDLKNLLTD